MQESSQDSILAQQFRAMLNHAPEAVVILDVGQQRFIDFNTKALAFFQMSREELLARGPAELSPPIVNGREAGPYAAAFIRAALQGTEPVFDWVHINSQNEEIPCEVRLTQFPPYDEQLVMANIIDTRERKELEDVLATSQERLELAMRATGLGYYDWLPQENELVWDERMCTIFGLDPGYEGDKNAFFFQILHPEDRERVVATFSSFLDPANNETIIEDHYRIFRGEELVHIITKGVGFRESAAGISRVIGTVQDVSEQKRAEIALKDREAFLRAIFDNSLNAIIVADDQGYYRTANQAAADMFGYSIEKLLTMHVSELQTVVGPNAAEQYATYLEKGSEIGEFRFIHSNGESRVAYYHSVRIGQDFNLSILADITELNAAREELASLTQRFQISTQAAKVGIWEWDMKKNHMLWDDTMLSLYGIKQADFANTYEDFIQRVVPANQALVEYEVALSIEENRNFNTEFPILWPDQSVHYIKSLGTVERNERGKPIRMIGTNWDITQEKEAEQQRILTRQLEIRNRELEQFAYVASHDLREPLRTITSFVGLFKRNHADQLKPEARDHLEFIAQAANRMNKLIKGLLEYSNIGQNRKLTAVDCTRLLEEILNDLHSQITEAKAHIQVDPLPNLKGYETELRMLFQNLVSNAIKFRKKGRIPHIQVSVKQLPGLWKFGIADNGIGIEPAYQGKIFALFQRLHSRTDYEGTGIGLAHCQKIVDLHGGRIWVESEPNVGSQFYFTLPQ